MKVLLKIKSAIVLLIATLTVHAQNEAFYVWDNDVPPVMNQEQMISAWQNGQKGIAVPGLLKVNCNESNYTALISKTAYSEMLNASASKFEFTKTAGTETNNGINPSTKKTAPGRTIAAGVPSIKFTASTGEVVHMKYGSNGCFNPLGNPRSISTTDPDEGGTPPKRNDPWVISNTPPAQSTININQGQSVESFYMTYRLGQSDMANIEDRTIDRTITAAERMSKINNCNGCGSASTGNLVLGVSNLSVSQGYQQPPQQQQGSVNNYYASQETGPKNPSFGKLVLASAVGTVAGGYVKDGIDYLIGGGNNNRGRNGYCYTPWIGNGGNGGSNFIPVHAPTGGSTRGNIRGNGTIRTTRANERNDFN